MRLRIHGLPLLTTLAVIGLATAPASAQVDPYAASTKTCESVVNDDVKSEFPKAKGIGWDMNSVTETKTSKREVHLKGSGSYKGDSGKKRTYTFDCTYDTKDNRVTAASWTSSFDRKQHVVVGGGSTDDAPTEADVARACREPVERVVSEGFPSTVGKLSFLEDTLELSEKKGVSHLSGEGRFRGGGGNWHRFEFTCAYDADDEEVTDATWTHLGDERDLD